MTTYILDIFEYAIKFIKDQEGHATPWFSLIFIDITIVIVPFIIYIFLIIINIVFFIMDDCLGVIKIIISFIISFNVSKLITIVSIFYVSVFQDFVLFFIYDFIILLISHVLFTIISASRIFILIIDTFYAFVDAIFDDVIGTI